MITKNINLKIFFFSFIICSFGTLPGQDPLKNERSNFLRQNIQQRLDAGDNPYDLVKEGIALKELYGKIYLDGYIFFIDAEDHYDKIKGMVCSLEDLALKDTSQNICWGCYGHDLIELSNVRFSEREYKTKQRNVQLMEKDLETGARIGDGLKNTNIILKECKEAISAARICVAQGPGWHLPSRGELYQIYHNLNSNNLGNFLPNYYWSSTEYDSIFAWIQNFKKGSKNDIQDGGNKNNETVRLRAIKSF